MFIFIACRHSIADAIEIVTHACLSVRLSLSGIVSKWLNIDHHIIHFLSRVSILTRDIDIGLANLSVCPSVRL